MTTGPVEWVEGDVGWASAFGQGGAVEVDGLAAALDGRRPEPYVGGYTAAGAPRVGGHRPGGSRAARP
jgi:hypothetical protein